MVHSLSRDGGVTVSAIIASEMVAEAMARQRLSPTASVALGRALMASALVAAGSPEGEKLQIQFKGDGPLGGMIALADSLGRVRGTVSNPAADPPPKRGRPDVATAVGRGILVVVRHHPARGEPQSGITPLSTGEVALDLARYLTESEQTPSALGLGVATAEDGSLQAAGGFLVQAHADARDEAVTRVEANVRSIQSTAALVRAGARGEDILHLLLEGVGAREIMRSRPRFHCPCARERVRRSVALLGREELRELIARGEQLEVRCEFCGELYQLGPDELGDLMSDAG
jgi:molecular chaperone Hsp33